MAPKRRSSETVEDEVIRKGYLTKSPPQSIVFSTRGSWKSRLIKVCRTPLGSYYIRYYAYNGTTEEFKGEIPISNIQSLELGTNIRDRIQTVLRIFNNYYSPEHVLIIKTSKRDYYLVDDNEQNIADWKAFLTDIWVKIHSTDNVTDGPQISKISSPTLETSLAPIPQHLKRGLGVYRNSPIQVHSTEEATSLENMPGASDDRPKSYPQDYPRTDTVLPKLPERKRSDTDYEKRRGILQPALEEIEKLEPPEEVPELSRCQTLPGWCPLLNEVRRFSLDENKNSPERRRDSGDSAEVDAPYSSDPEQESIYDFPRSIPVAKHPSLECTEGEISDYDSPDDDVYQIMDPVPHNIYQMGSETVEPSSPPADQKPPCAEKTRECSSALKKADSCPPKPTRTSKLFVEPNRYPGKTRGSQLKKAYILKLMYEETDSVKLDLKVPTAHLQKYLGLQEVGERLCVSKWKGPSEIGCLFHYGDHIEAINGVRTEAKEFFFQILNNSMAPEVSLTVIRKTNAAVFHIEGCQCGES